MQFKLGGAGRRVVITACADGINKKVEHCYALNGKEVRTGGYITADLTKPPKRYEPWMLLMAGCILAAEAEAEVARATTAPLPYPNTAFGSLAVPEEYQALEREELHRQLISGSMLGETTIAGVEEALKQVWDAPPHQLPHGTKVLLVDDGKGGTDVKT